MGNNTRVSVVTFAAGSATILLWLIGYFSPDLMNQAPVGLEAAITGVITALISYLTP